MKPIQYDLKIANFAYIFVNNVIKIKIGNLTSVIVFTLW